MFLSKLYKLLFICLLLCLLSNINCIGKKADSNKVASIKSSTVDIKDKLITNIKSKFDPDGYYFPIDSLLIYGYTLEFFEISSIKQPGIVSISIILKGLNLGHDTLLKIKSDKYSQDSLAFSFDVPNGGKAYFRGMFLIKGETYSDSKTIESNTPVIKADILNSNAAKLFSSKIFTYTVGD